MMKHLKLFSFLILLLGLFSCTNEVGSGKLNFNEGLYLLDGTVYTGKVVDKNKSGRIVKSFYCEEGKLEGDYLQYFKNGNLSTKKQYSVGLLNGVSKENFKNGSRKEIHHFRNGFFEGLQISYYENNLIKEFYFLKKGKRNGYFVIRPDYGSFVRGNYKNDLFYGFWIYNKIGEFTAQGKYFNGDGTEKGVTEIPRNGRLGKWIFKLKDYTQVQNYSSSKSKFFKKKVFNSLGSLIYESSVNRITEDEIVFHGTPTFGVLAFQNL